MSRRARTISGVAVALATSLMLGVSFPASAEEVRNDTKLSAESTFTSSVAEAIITTDEGSSTVSDDGIVTQTVSGDHTAATVVTEPDAELTPSEMKALATHFKCTVNTDRPHASHHVDGNINVVSETECEITVAQIRSATELYRVTPSTHRCVGKPVVKPDRHSLSSNAATNCSAGPGTFQGLGLGTIIAPAGVKLDGSPSFTKRGKTVPVACGQKNASVDISGPTDDSAEVLELHFIRTDLADDYTWEELEALD